MFKSLNRSISAPIVIVVIVFCALLVGGVVVWQYLEMPKEEVETPETIKPPADETLGKETADWKTYRFVVKKLEEIEGITEEKRQEVQEKIKERKLESCSFEIKYPPSWTTYTWPLHGFIVPEGLFIEEDPESHNGCSFQMSFYGDPEKEKYCFPTSLSSGESDSEGCNKIFNKMLSTFRFIEVDETADWETYRNEEYEYIVKYPENWSAYDSTENDCFTEHPCLFSLNLISPIATGWVNVEVFDNSEKLSLRDWLEKYKLGEIKTEKFIDEIEVSGNNGIRLRYTPIARGYMLNYIYLSREEFIYEISFITEIDNPPENAINQVLSTFRFLKEEKITIFSPSKGDKWKVGETYQIRWTPSDPEGTVVIRLYKAPVASLNLKWEPSYSQHNIGSYSFIPFKGLETEKEYQFCISAYGGTKEGYKGCSDKFVIVSE